MRLLLPLLLLSAACTPALEGSWSGDLSCNDQDMDLELDLDEDGDGEFEGDGELSWDDDGVFWSVKFDVTLSPDSDALSSITTLDVELDNCEEIDLGEVDCAEVSNAWHSKSEDEIHVSVDEVFEYGFCSGDLD